MSQQNVQLTQNEGDLLIRADELTQLDNIIGDIPTKHGLPIINLFRTLHRNRAIEVSNLQRKIQEAASKKENKEQVTTGTADNTGTVEETVTETEVITPNLSENSENGNPSLGAPFHNE